MKSSKEDFLKNIPKKGFIKFIEKKSVSLAPEQKVKLIRKANEMYNNNRLEEAGNIFITLNHADGILRLGDHYLSKNKPLEAYKMYQKAGSAKHMEILHKRFAQVVQTWLSSSASGSEKKSS